MTTSPSHDITICPTEDPTRDKCGVPWCSGDDRDPDEPTCCIHSRSVGSLGVEICANEYDGTLEQSKIYLPSIEGSDELTPEQGAHLGQSLMLAVAILAGAR